MTDGIRLSAKLWLPETGVAVPAILEYAPYRKSDATSAGDERMYGYLAAHGYACVRVDMRGCGDSDGILEGEYLAQEQDDAIDVLAWIAEQPWADGSVGMIGISWTGFNALQVAYAVRPAEGGDQHVLHDDRYRDDIHYMGGCVLGVDMLRVGDDDARLQRPPAAAGGRRRRLAGDLAATDRGDAAVRRGLARAPAARRLLEARVDLRVLRHGRVPAADGRRLGRRLPQRHPAGSRAVPAARGLA